MIANSCISATLFLNVPQKLLENENMLDKWRHEHFVNLHSTHLMLPFPQTIPYFRKI